MKIYLSRLCLFILLVYFYSCANQLPPSGGKDDSEPPKLVYVFPKPNSTFVKGNKIIFKFNEYVDRRSFEESFFLTPRTGNEYEFDWSGKEVEVVFKKNFELDRTYVINIGKDFKDIRGGNSLSSPVTIAFSTGAKLDKGALSGKVYSDKYERVKVMMYFLKNVSDTIIDPAKSPPDYVVQVSEEGIYEFTNLPDGKLRLFAVVDEDRNNVYDPDLDKIALLPDDVNISGDSILISDLNFILEFPESDIRSSTFLKTLKSDSADYIFTNIISTGKNFITPDHRFYFYFKNKNPDKIEVVENFLITDTAAKKNYKPVFNWINDSLLEVFTQESFDYNSQISVEMDLAKTNYYRYFGLFSVFDKDKFGSISGEIKRSDESIPVIIKLFSLSENGINYTETISDTLSFKIENILEGKYLLFAYLDENIDGNFDRGNVSPYDAPEKYILYDRDFEIKGSESIDKIIIEF